ARGGALPGTGAQRRDPQLPTRAGDRMSARPVREPSLLQALAPLLFLSVALALGVYLYADTSSYGANQISLLLAAGIAAIIGLRNGLAWDEIQGALVHGVSIAVVPIFILLAVGALIGTWVLSGTVPMMIVYGMKLLHPAYFYPPTCLICPIVALTLGRSCTGARTPGVALSGTVPMMIVYGMKLLHPAYFYPATCLICAIVALTIGSSWTVAGTLGVALIGVAQGLDMSLPITAGAIISGAYFGDKMSPLSDTTNIAPAAAGSELFAHIRHMVWTTGPSIAIALLMFALVGLGNRGSGEGAAFGDLPALLDARFALGWHLLLPMLVVLVLAMRRFPAFPTIMVGALLGAVFAVVFQPDVVVALAGNEALSRPMALLSGAWKALFNGYQAETGNAALDDLLSRGGMSTMLNTVWLIVCAMGFGAVMERTGLLERMIRSVLKAARSTGSLVAATLATAFGANVVTADQYMSIVLTGRLFQPEYRRRGLDPVNLSRALE